MKYDGLLFDLDGTMWNATENIRISWNIAVKTFDELKDRDISTEKLKGVMGLPMDESMYENPQKRTGCHCLSCKTELLTPRVKCEHNCVYCFWKS